MEIDRDKIDEAVLALLYLGWHDDIRTGKTFDWDAMDRLHAKGMIFRSGRQSKVRGVQRGGLRRSEQLFNQLFGAYHISTNREDRS